MADTHRESNQSQNYTGKTISYKKSSILGWLAPVLVSAGLATVAIVVTVSTARSPTVSGPADNSEDYGVATLGRPAPDFNVELIDSGTFRLSEAKGKVVLINFWGTWCAPCEKEMPLLQRASKAFEGELIVVGLAVNDSKDAVLKFRSRLGITFPVGLDDGRVAGYYLVSGFPTTVIVGKDGTVVSRESRAFLDYESLIKEIDKARLQSDS
ncbi:MAG: TlpA family protein disulfide reductase [Acidimicrobiia bacterium]